MIKNIFRRVIEWIRIRVVRHQVHGEVIQDAYNSYSSMLSNAHGLKFTSTGKLSLYETTHSSNIFNKILYNGSQSKEQVGTYIIVPSTKNKDRTYIIHAFNENDAGFLEGSYRFAKQRTLLYKRLNRVVSGGTDTQLLKRGDSKIPMPRIRRLPYKSVLVAVVDSQDMIAFSEVLRASKLKKLILEIKTGELYVEKRKP